MRLTLLRLPAFCCLWILFLSVKAEGFLLNQGQWPEQVLAASEYVGGKVWVEKEGLTVLTWSEEAERLFHDHVSGTPPQSMEDSLFRSHAYKVHFSVPFVSSHSEDPLAYSTHLFYGSDPQGWFRDIPSAGSLHSQFAQGISLKAYESEGHFKYEWILEPGASPQDIWMDIQGADRLSLQDGNLLIETSVGTVVEPAPLAWQILDGKKTEVTCHFVLDGDRVSFVFPEGYDPAAKLVIDPELIFSTWSGASGVNYGACATKGENGTLIAAGIGLNQLYPTTTGVLQSNFAGVQDMVISKYAPDGSTLLFSTYIGGSRGERPLSLLLNDNFDIYILGVTGSSDYPISANAFDNSQNGADDLMITQIDASGSNLLASSYLGGNGNEGALGINIFDSGERSEIVWGPDGNLYGVSSSTSLNFPTSPNAYLPFIFSSGTSSAVVFKMDPGLSNLLWGTYLGSGYNDMGYGIRVNDNNEVFVCGGSFGGFFPTTANAYQSQALGNWEAWVSRLSNDGSQLLASTYLSTTNYDMACMLELDEQGKVWVTGQTMSHNFPSTAGAFAINRGKNFICRLDQDLSNLEISSLMGSGRNYPDLTPTAFTLDSCGHIYLAGWASRIRNHLPKLPITPDAIQSITDPRNLYLMVLGQDADTLLFASYFGGKFSHEHSHARTNFIDEQGVLYHAVCSGCRLVNLPGPPNPASPGSGGVTTVHSSDYNDWPDTPGAWATDNLSRSCNLTAFKVDFQFWEVIAGLVNYDSMGVCLGESITLADNSLGGHVWEWDMGDGTILSGDSVNHRYTAAGTYRVQMAVYDSIRCIPFDTAYTDVIIHPLPIADAGPDQSMCLGGSIQLQGSGNGTFSWTPSQNISNASTAQPTVNPGSDRSYYLEVSSSFGCKSVDSVRVEVFEVKADLGFSPETVERNDPIWLLDQSIGASSWSWDLGDGRSSTLQNLETSYDEDGEYTVSLVIEGLGGCVDSAQGIILIETFSKIFIPSAFSPNNDGLNEVFQPVYEDITDVDLEIWSRDGALIYQGSGTNAAWDGRFADQAAPEGSYVFILRGIDKEGKKLKKSGTVTLIR